jgi:sugar phosphate permease
MLRGKIKAELSKTTRPHPTMLAALFCGYVAVFLVRESFSACVSLIVPFVSTSRTYVSSGPD